MAISLHRASILVPSVHAYCIGSGNLYTYPTPDTRSHPNKVALKEHCHSLGPPLIQPQLPPHHDRLN
eukprot:4142902-Amphidinium_carterae.1